MAELILLLHLLVILFFLAGFPLGLLYNRPWFRYFHAISLSLITLMMVVGIPCPITLWEEQYRGESYQGSFIATWLNRIIYMEWFNPSTVLVGDLVFLAAVVSSFFWYPLRRNKSRNRKVDPPK